VTFVLGKLSYASIYLLMLLPSTHVEFFFKSHVALGWNTGFALFHSSCSWFISVSVCVASFKDSKTFGQLPSPFMMKTVLFFRLRRFFTGLMLPRRVSTEAKKVPFNTCSTCIKIRPIKRLSNLLDNGTSIQNKISVQYTCSISMARIATTTNGTNYGKLRFPRSLLCWLGIPTSC